ncbi:DUF2382 domain-containing protein [Deinococcus maricopensis]|uniref:DUF2382 domain-containing protein n=1 Tax=Deinococcus maricopensis (strain DSM 21211 / LMG 22137 / NRRL B-23946 / LB-34) TaxID=709986 RepID=E8U529_DEIML|nr:DUF2382 domain-containing protein [Deinococcus maricopensis]ADV66168.1 Conserved hypothetical protein CHP02271 [Deinococcus maricopensis DSM 21211]
MAYLTTLSDLSRERNYNLHEDGLMDPVGQHAYAGTQRIGTVRDALVDANDARLRYLIVDLNGEYGDRGVIVPIGFASIENDGIHFDTLTREQIAELHHYHDNELYSYDAQVSDERVLRGQEYTGSIGYREDASAEQRYNYRDEDTSDRFFKTPERLQLLEERLRVDKERYRAGAVEIGKHVETRQEHVNVPVSHEEVVIERHAVSGAQPVAGDVTLGADRETIRVDLEAERANVRKEAFVTEEVNVEKRSVAETQTVTETVGREVLDVNRTGDTTLRTEDAARDDTRDRH